METILTSCASDLDFHICIRTCKVNRSEIKQQTELQIRRERMYSEEKKLFILKKEKKRIVEPEVRCLCVCLLLGYKRAIYTLLSI